MKLKVFEYIKIINKNSYFTEFFKPFDKEYSETNRNQC